MEKLRWEALRADSNTYRLKVPGGWVIQYNTAGNSEQAVSMCFVPDPLEITSSSLLSKFDDQWEDV